MGNRSSRSSSVERVIAGECTHHIEQADCLEFLRGLPENSVDLCVGSPPYEQARLYLENGENLGVSRKTDTWVAWMVEVFQAAQRACKGLVAMVVAGQTKNYRWSAGPALLMAELHRAGMNLRNPPIFSRVGIPGSGGPDWLRGDYEWIVCTSKPGRLPWSENTACGHPPKWAPGGEMAHRLTNGQRVNGGTDPWMKRDRGNNLGGRRQDGTKKLGTDRRADAAPETDLLGEAFPQEADSNGRDKWGGTGHDSSGEGRKTNGEHKTRNKKHGRRITRGHANGDTPNEDAYDPPVKANPGNEIQQTYTFTEKQLAEFLDAYGQHGDILRYLVGGGVMGNKLCHENEAPYPFKLAEFFVRSFCPPGGITLDPFSGSGTTADAALTNGRRFLGCDLRASQVELTLRRLATVTAPTLFAE